MQVKPLTEIFLCLLISSLQTIDVKLNVSSPLHIGSKLRLRNNIIACNSLIDQMVIEMFQWNPTIWAKVTSRAKLTSVLVHLLVAQKFDSGY